MATIKHPVTGKPRLEWIFDGNGVHVAQRVQQAKYRKGQAYDVTTVFAHVRPAYNALGLLDANGGWVVTRNNFDEIREFTDFEMAKLYVHSLFELEFGAE